GKGKKVCVVGEVSARAYEGKDGEAKASLEVFVTEVEFLSPRGEEREPVSTAMPSYSQEQLDHAKQTAVDGEFTEITDGDLPF
ncbi:MAG: single-stranded DNA-binding protein, partial [Ruminococcus sp.]|nr:single-stranded DNA-binding protein [Ruminococcus sp.]